MVFVPGPGCGGLGGFCGFFLAVWVCAKSIDPNKIKNSLRVMELSR
jgi:hypothetical protein